VLARELEDEPGVDRAERGVRRHVALADQPLDLRAGEVWVEHQPGALAKERLVAGLLQLVAATRGAPVLPDDRAVQRLAAVTVPRDHRLALVRDPDAGERAAVDAGRVERLLSNGARHVPDLARVVLDPARAREVLLELAVARPTGWPRSSNTMQVLPVVPWSIARIKIRQPIPPVSSRPMPDVEAHITGTVWKIDCQVGQAVEEGDTLVILESMKMEMPVEAEDDGTVKEIVCSEGQSVSEGETLVILE
jgi:acetyl-CoA carboxylase biotin carboxyl carrier protein